MFFFPLGLVAKLDKIPFLSLSIVLLTTMTSIYFFDEIQTASNDSSQNIKFENLVTARIHLLAENCASTELGPEKCDQLIAAIHANQKLKGIELLKVVANKITSLESSKLILKLLVNNQYWLDRGHEFANNKSYLHFTNQLLEYETYRHLQNQQKNYLTKNTISLQSLFKAQLTHADWAHLIGNMLFLILLIPFVEQRVGAINTLGIYFFTGAFGLLGHLYFTEDSNQLIIGASANVFGIAGAFLVLFFKKSVKIWSSFFFIINRETQLPCWAYFSLFVLASEVQGLIASSSAVAHDAHLIAMALGGGLGVFGLKFLSVPEPMVYPYELKTFRLAQESESSVQLGLLSYLIERNPGNHLVLKALLIELNRKGVPWDQLQPWLCKALIHSLQVNLQSTFNSNPDEVNQWLSLWPPEWPSEPLIVGLELNLAHLLLNYYIHSNQVERAKNLEVAYRNSLANHQREVFDRTIEINNFKVEPYEQPAV